MTPEQTAKLEALQPRLERAAIGISNRSAHTIPADDIVQEANLAIIERAMTDPTFMDQTPSYIMQHGLWKARDQYRSKGTLGRYDARTVSLDALNADESTDYQFPADAVVVDDDLDLSVAVQQAIDTLGDTAKAICIMLANGYKKAEIARALGIQRQSINWHVKKARAALSQI